jgi:hypothetical protein
LSIQLLSWHLPGTLSGKRPESGEQKASGFEYDGAG